MKFKKKSARGFCAEYRYIIENGGVHRRKVSIIGDTAFVHSIDRRGFRKGETARILPARLVFKTQQQAVRASKAARGFIVRSGNLFPGRRLLRGDGQESLYNMKGESVWGGFFPTKAGAIRELLREAKEWERRSRRDFRAASRRLAQVRKQARSA